MLRVYINIKSGAVILPLLESTSDPILTRPTRQQLRDSGSGLRADAASTATGNLGEQLIGLGWTEICVRDAGVAGLGTWTNVLWRETQSIDLRWDAEDVTRTRRQCHGIPRGTLMDANFTLIYHFRNGCTFKVLHLSLISVRVHQT